MAKKTKRQKKRSDARKYINSASLKTNTPLIHQKNTQPTITTEDSYLPTPYIVTDLKKTLLITFSLFTLEFIVFYAKLKGII